MAGRFKSRLFLSLHMQNYSTLYRAFFKWLHMNHYLVPFMAHFRAAKEYTDKLCINIPHYSYERLRSVYKIEELREILNRMDYDYWFVVDRQLDQWYKKTSLGYLHQFDDFKQWYKKMYIQRLHVKQLTPRLTPQERKRRADWKREIQERDKENAPFWRQLRLQRNSFYGKFRGHKL